MHILRSEILTFITLFAILLFMAGLAEPSTGKGIIFRNYQFGSINQSQSDCRIVINELMVDPTPVVGLPDFEWIELYNAGNCEVNLAGWRIVVGTTSRTFSGAILPPGGYIIVCTQSGSSELQKWGPTAAISLPALRNTGNRISLFKLDGSLADEVNYSDKWYNDNKKKDGGWTLERIDPNRSCGEAANWKASIDPKGGTPGKINSVFADNTDNVPPIKKWVGATSANSIDLIFSEPIDTLKMKEILNYSLSNGMGNPLNVLLKGENTVALSWGNSMEANKSYILTLINISDACGNQLLTNSFVVQWTILEKEDVVVNEVLFNPLSGGVDFVELFNRSPKRIDAGKLVLAGRDRNLNLRQQVSLRSLNKIFEPGEMIAVTINRDNVLSVYRSLCPACIYNLPSMPAYNNDEGWVVIMYDNQNILDEFHYTEKMHHKLLHNVKGVSLERVNPNLPSTQPGNWQSASSDVGYATPGYTNSQYLSKPQTGISLTVEPRAFSPNGDGYNDVLVISYETTLPGCVGNAWVFDTSGRTIMQLLKNQLLATHGTLTWNGEDKSGSQVPLGPYILFFEMYDLAGNVERFKKAIYITERYE